MFVTQGRVHYYDDYCVAYIDKNIGVYYRRLLPRAWYVQPPAYPPHATVIRKGIEVAPSGEKNWGKYQDMLVPIYYLEGVESGGPYFWLTAFSPQLNVIRQELGLHPYRFPFDCSHITIGNIKNRVDKS